MALSMDEQRMLAEIERRLTAEDPGLAVRLSTFRRPGRSAGFRGRRGRVVGSVCAIVVLAVIGAALYAAVPFRGHSPKAPPGRMSSAQPATSAPVKAGPSAGASAG
jgi:hypothetical protein